jgi:hypothetical protein
MYVPQTACASSQIQNNSGRSVVYDTCTTIEFMDMHGREVFVADVAVVIPDEFRNESEDNSNMV